MTKIRIYLTISVLIVAAVAITFFDFFYSPITGTVTTNALNGGVAEYGMARFVQNGHFTKIIQLTAIGILSCIWVPFIIHGK